MIGTRTARATLARHGKTFSKAALLLPRAVADDLAGLYAFCRTVDDIADETDDPAVARERLARVRDDLRAGRTDDALVATFADLSERHDVPVDCALDLIDGIASDLGRVEVESRAELLRYAYRVAGTVGVMCASVLGVHDATTRRFAADLGIGMQLTNIARDVAEDFARGRQYVPVSLVAPDDLRRAVDGRDAASIRLHAATAELLTWAERYYASGELGIPALPPRVRWGILTAARSYRAIGVEVLALGPGGRNTRARTSTLTKARCALRAGLDLARARAGARAEHSADLHDALRRLPSARALGWAS